MVFNLFSNCPAFGPKRRSNNMLRCSFGASCSGGAAEWWSWAKEEEAEEKKVVEVVEVVE